MLNYKKPVKVKQRVVENEQVTIAPADTKTQVIKAGNKTIGTVSNPTVANQLKTAIQKGEVNLAQDLKEMDAPPGSVFKVKITYKSPSGGYASGIIKVPANNSDVAKKYVQTHVKKPELRVVSATLDKTTNVDKMFDKTGDAQDLKEEAPPDQEQWVKDNKEKFIKQYGKKGEAILYATAWQRHNEGVKESKQLNLDHIFESVAFDEPAPVSHILSKFKFEVNQFCQGSAINPDLYDCLYDYYLDAGLMPYGVAKARDANPIEWVSSKLKDYLGSCGVSYGDVEQPEIAEPVSEPVPEYGDDSTEQVADEPIDATDSDEPTEQEINQMFESIMGKSLKPKVKESKMKKTVTSTPNLTESWTDDKTKIVARLKPILTTYGLKATVGLKNSTIEVKIPSGKLDFITNYVNKAVGDKSAVLRALRTKNIQVSPDGVENFFTGTPLKALKEMFKAIQYSQYGVYHSILIGGVDGSYVLTGPKDPYNEVTLARFSLKNPEIKESKMKKKVAESAIDRKAKALVDSWNLKLKQKLKESADPKNFHVVIKGADIDGTLTDIGVTYNSVKLDRSADEFKPDGYKVVDLKTGKPVKVSGSVKAKIEKVLDIDVDRVVSKLKLTSDDNYDKSGKLIDDFDEVAWKIPSVTKVFESKRSLKEGISVSTSQSQGFGYDDIDQNTSINVCATGEDAIRLAEILRDAGFGQFKTNHIAVNSGSTVIDNPVIAQVEQPEYDPMPTEYDSVAHDEYHGDDQDDGESELLDRIQQFVSYGNPASAETEEITEAEEVYDSEVVVHTPSGKLGFVVDADTGADNEYEVMFADGTEVVSGTDLEPATQAQINASKDIVKYVGDDAQFAGRYGVIIEEDGDEYHVAFSDGETWIVASDLEAPALQESFANELTMNQPAQTAYMTHGMSGGLNSLRRSQATGNVTRISTMESKGKQRKMLKESAVRVKPDDDLASMANLVEAISVQQRIKFGA